MQNAPSAIRRVATVLALAALLLPSAPLLGPPPLGLAAQQGDVPSIVPGTTVTGFLDPGGPDFQGRGAFAVYRMEARAGLRYEAELRSDDFDAYLVLLRAAGPLTEVIREDDDGAGAPHARIRFTAPEGGTYLLVAQEWSAGSGGTFTLALTERPLPAPRPAAPLPPGGQVEGELTDDSPVLLTDWGDEIAHDLWSFEGSGGEHWRISLVSADFDPYLEFGPLSGGELQVTDTDDDGGDGLNALLRVILPHDGRFGIRARPLGEGSLGRYHLEAARFDPEPVLRRTIGSGEPVTGTFTLEGAVLEGGIPYHEWIYEGTEGERITISMRSTEVDSYLSLGRETDGGFVELAWNDDAPGEGLDARIDHTLTTTGPYVIRARTFGAGAPGSYTLLVEPER